MTTPTTTTRMTEKATTKATRKTAAGLGGKATAKPVRSAPAGTTPTPRAGTPTGKGRPTPATTPAGKTPMRKTKRTEGPKSATADMFSAPGQFPSPADPTPPRPAGQDARTEGGIPDNPRPGREADHEHPDA